MVASGKRGVVEVEEGGAEDEDGAEDGAEDGGAEEDAAKEDAAEDDGVTDGTAEMVEDAEGSEDTRAVEDLRVQTPLLFFFFVTGETVTVAETVLTTVVVYSVAVSRMVSYDVEVSSTVE